MVTRECSEKRKAQRKKGKKKALSASLDDDVW